MIPASCVFRDRDGKIVECHTVPVPHPPIVMLWRASWLVEIYQRHDLVLERGKTIYNETEYRFERFEVPHG